MLRGRPMWSIAIIFGVLAKYVYVNCEIKCISILNDLQSFSGHKNFLNILDTSKIITVWRLILQLLLKTYAFNENTIASIEIVKNYWLYNSTDSKHILTEIIVKLLLEIVSVYSYEITQMCIYVDYCHI